MYGDYFRLTGREISGSTCVVHQSDTVLPSSSISGNNDIRCSSLLKALSDRHWYPRQLMQNTCRTDYTRARTKPRIHIPCGCPESQRHRLHLPTSQRWLLTSKMDLSTLWSCRPVPFQWPRQWIRLDAVVQPSILLVGSLSFTFLKSCSEDFFDVVYFKNIL